MIRNSLRLLLAVPGLWALAGCESMNKTEQGAVGGGLLGGTAGALIGSTTGHTGAGAAIGAGLGAVSGGLIGNSIEESEHKAKAVAEASAVPAPGQLSHSDVEQMSQQSQQAGGANYDSAAVMLDAPANKVYSAVVRGLQNNTQGVTITREDPTQGLVQFTNGQQIAGIKVSALSDDLTHMLISSAHTGNQPDAQAGGGTMHRADGHPTETRLKAVTVGRVEQGRHQHDPGTGEGAQHRSVDDPAQGPTEGHQ